MKSETAHHGYCLWHPEYGPVYWTCRKLKASTLHEINDIKRLRKDGYRIVKVKLVRVK